MLASPKPLNRSHYIESISFSAILDALGDIRLGKSFKAFPPLPMTWALIVESVAHKKTPMLDLVPTRPNTVLDRYHANHSIAIMILEQGTKGIGDISYQLHPTLAAVEAADNLLRRRVRRDICRGRWWCRSARSLCLRGRGALFPIRTSQAS